MEWLFYMKKIDRLFRKFEDLNVRIERFLIWHRIIHCAEKHNAHWSLILIVLRSWCRLKEPSEILAKATKTRDKLVTKTRDKRATKLPRAAGPVVTVVLLTKDAT